MDTHRQSNGLQTFLGHWGFLVTVIVVFLASQVLLFFMGLSGDRGFGFSWRVPRCSLSAGA
jgi:hypothetical protein